ncbi:heme peroxidase [Macleaya cordata]|uniref:Heme peroxidase n=1 Tax=Macleaya cordata TaxID=56857 RepID=A0A200QJ32_MACCD|nr:heme peroxidase [Macleaya cordata]
MAQSESRAGQFSYIEDARRFLRAAISGMHCAPAVLRLAWLDATSYDVNTNTGGVNGSARYNEKVVKDSGLSKATDLCEQVKIACPQISYADLIQLAGVVAVEVTGGPTIDFIPGRQDISPEDREHDAPAQDLRSMFYRMGLLDSDIVALSGGYALARNHQERLCCDNDGIWYISTPDEAAFLRDYAVSHKKLSELGFRPPSNPSVIYHDETRRISTFDLTARDMAVVIAAVAFAFGQLFEVRRRVQ